MNRHEKIAWYNIVVIGVSVLFFIVLFSSMKNSHTLEASFRTSSAAFGVLGLLGLGPTLFRKKGSQRLTSFFDPEMDERDVQIYRRAGLHAFSVLWTLSVLVVMGIWMYFGRTPEIEGPVILQLNVDMLPFFIFPGFLLLMLVYSISALVQHRSNAASENSFDGPLVPNMRSMVVSLGLLPIFILFGLFIAFQGEYLFAFQFITLALGAFTMTVHEIRRKTAYPESNPAAHRFAILARIFNIIFSLLFAGLLVTCTVRIIALGSFPKVFIGYLVTLVFIGWIFHRTVLMDLNYFIRKRRHEKA